MAFALNLNWSPVGRIIIRKTRDPQVFIFRFTEESDFAAAIYSNPNRVHGKLLTLRIWSGDENVNRIDFSAHDFWIIFTLRSDLAEREDIARKIVEKVGKVLALIGPVEDGQGVFKAHVMVNLLYPLINVVKVIIIDGNDRESINVKIFYGKLPHATCRTCWTIDHRRDECEANRKFGRRNIPKVIIQNEENVNMIRNGRWVQRSRPVNSVERAVAGLRIYDSEIDRERRQGQKRMRMEIEEIHDQNHVAVTTTLSLSSNLNASVENSIISATSQSTTATPMPVESGNPDAVSLEDLRKALKGKSKVSEDGRKEKIGSEGSVNGSTKAEKQKRRFSDWARMLGQYVSMGTEGKQLTIGKERSKSMLSEWVKIDGTGAEKDYAETPIEVTEKVLDDESNENQSTPKERLEEQRLVEFATTDMSEKDFSLFTWGVVSGNRSNTVMSNTSSNGDVQVEPAIELQGIASIPENLGEDQDIVQAQRMQKPELAEKQQDGAQKMGREI